MCGKRNCGCNKPGNSVICYTNTPVQPCIGVNLTVNNTESSDGSTDTSMILEETNNISAYKEHLEFVNSPEPLSGLKRNVVLRITQSFINTISNIFRGRNVGTGAKLYKGLRVEGADTFQDFRTLKGSDSILVTENIDEIIATVDSNWLEDQFIPIVADISNKLDKPSSPNNINTKVILGDGSTKDLSEISIFYINTDDTLLIVGGAINSKISTIEDQFENSNTVELNFPPVQILGVYLDGLRLQDNQFNFIPPNIINIPTANPINRISVEYRHLVTDI